MRRYVQSKNGFRKTKRKTLTLFLTEGERWLGQVVAVVNGGRSRTVEYSVGRLQRHVGSCWLHTVRSSFPDSSYDILVGTQATGCMV